MIRATFEASDALDNLLPRATYTVVSNFSCEFDDKVLGVWVKANTADPNQVIPLYLTQAQLEEITYET